MSRKQRWSTPERSEIPPAVFVGEAADVGDASGRVVERQPNQRELARRGPSAPLECGSEDSVSGSAIRVCERLRRSRQQTRTVKMKVIAHLAPELFVLADQGTAMIRADGH
jgi:hypothetical protein